VKKNLTVTSVNDAPEFSSSEKDIFDQIINHSRSMISIINKDYIYEKVNSTFCKEHQIVNDSVIGKSLEDVWGVEIFRYQIKNKIDLCFSGETVSYEASFRTPRLGQRYYEVVFRPLTTGNDGITHLLAETFDINELRLSKQEALEKEEELRKFETNLPIGFLRCNPNGKIIYANKAFMSIMECPDDTHALNMNMKRFYPVDILFEIHVEQLLESRTKTFGRFFLKNWKGSEIPCRISGFLTMDRSDNPSFIDFVIEDSSRELMLENKLLQAQKLETIGALAGGIAHDFNNILATISGYSEMLQEDLPKDSLLSDKVSKIQGAVLKAQSIINQILTFSRQVEQEKIQVNVSEVLKETIGFVKSCLPSNVVIKSRLPNRGENVSADPTQLFRVFLNLMTNAIQAMEEKGGTLFVSMTVVDGKLVQHELNKDIVADEYFLLTFRDTGKGMESSILERIFEPFFTTREVGKGTGLGLSVIHGIITELEGEILVSSQKEKGSIFYVYLPVTKEYEDVSEPVELRKKLLFITGNRYESRILSIALEKSGYELVYLTDRRNLIKMMNTLEGRPDLIIYMSESKQVRPEEVIRVFSQLRIDIPCILITDNNQDLNEEKLLNSGIVKQHLIKPVSLKEIRSAILESLR
jgi:two-component system, cell cycle sensor histidine kinase and response regulator CckA